MAPAGTRGRQQAGHRGICGFRVRPPRPRAPPPLFRRALLRRVLVLASVLWLSCAAGVAVAVEALPRTVEEVERYLSEHGGSLSEQFAGYNDTVGLLRSPNGSRKLMGAYWSLQRLDGERVFLIGQIEVGRGAWDSASGRFTFEFLWRGGGLDLVRHGPAPPQQKGGVTGEIGTDCSPNYFSHRPCPDTARRWTEFSQLYGLPLDRSSATIFQAFAEHDFRTGERLLAEALGEPPDAVRSVFPLQAEVEALNLSRYQRNLESPCDLNSYGSRPCPEIEGVFRSFARRHGLPEGPAAAQMFAAYAAGDFRSGDALYALARDLPRPRYEQPTTGIGREAARAGLRPAAAGEAGDCALNPFATRPCLGALVAWQDFRERYRLPDELESARIFEAYAEGDFKSGDALFAEAKGVSVAQLLEAAGVPADRLVIEVYPGRR